MQLTPFALEHEEGLALFVEPTYRSRFRESLASPKRREKLISTLDHFPNLDYRWAVEITTKATTSTVDAYLRNAGAPKQCYVLSSDGDYLQANESEGFKFILGTTVDLRVALDDLLWNQFGAFISCIPGRLACFTGEMPDERFVLERPPT